MSTPVCIANAVADATGEQDLTLPLIASKVARIVHGEEPPPPSGDKVEESHATDGLLRGDGETVVPAPSDLVWETLLNPEALAAVIPGCHKLDEVEKNSYQAEVSLGVGPVRGKFRAKVALSDIIEGKSTTLSGGLEGPLGTSSGVGHVVLSGEDGKTIVTYDYAIKLSGTVASVGGRMLEGAAKALVKQFFNRLTAQITGQKDSGSSSGGSTNGLWAFIKRILGLKS
jgi:2-furoyl-CoA dehydrogenase large subunit